MALRRNLVWRKLAPYASGQFITGCTGTMAAHGMFDLPLLQLAIKVRAAPAQ